MSPSGPTGPASVPATSTGGAPITSPPSTLKTLTTATGVVTTASLSHGGNGLPGQCSYAGCFNLLVELVDILVDFILIETSAQMTPELCTNECSASGARFSGLHQNDCYCAKTLDNVDAANGVCNIPCPGNNSLSCGGNGLLPDILNFLIDVFECIPTSTSTISSTTTSTSSSTPNPSSDADIEPEAPNIQADIALSPKTARDAKLRRGGMLKSLQKKKAGNVLAKKDFGIKKIFGS